MRPTTACPERLPPADPAALADALNRLLRDRALARRMGLAGRRRVEEHFSWASIAARTRRMYDELLEEKARSCPANDRADGHRR